MRLTASGFDGDPPRREFCAHRVAASLAVMVIPRILFGLGGILVSFHQALAAAEPPPNGTAVAPHFEEVLTILVLLGLVVISGLVWIWVIRRGHGQRLQVIRQREKALEDHYRELFENSHDILFTLDEEGRLVALNNAGEQIIGLARTEATRVRFEDRLHLESKEAFRAALALVRSGELVPAMELRVHTGGGRQTILRVDLRLHHPGGGEPRVQGIAWDITPQKEAERALRESELKLRQSLEERVQLGRDLHDGIIQSIYALGLGLNEARKLISRQPAEAETRLKSAIDGLNRIIREVRGFIEELEPTAVTGDGFREALLGLVSSTGMEHAPRIELEIDEAVFGVLGSGRSAQLLQCAREAVSNSLRHSRARLIGVTLRSNAGRVYLAIQDDGCGFDVAALTARGRGLANMENRALRMGGRISLTSKPAGGTRVELDVPMTE